MSPTIFNSGPYRYFFFSREEARMHVHVESGNGEAKFWLEPMVALADYKHLSKKELLKIQTEVESRKDEITKAWRKHFSS